MQIGELARVGRHVVQPLSPVRALDVLVSGRPDGPQAQIVDAPVELGVSLPQHVNRRLDVTQLGNRHVAGRPERRKCARLKLRPDRRFQLGRSVAILEQRDERREAVERLDEPGLRPAVLPARVTDDERDAQVRFVHSEHV